MKILSLNVWGGMVHLPLIDYLAAVDADVYCLQEVPRTPASRADWLVYRDNGVELQQRANLFDEIKASLPGHDGVFAPAACGDLFDGDTVVPSLFGLGTFVRKTFAVAEQALGFVHGAYSPHGFGPHPRARNAHCLRLCDISGDPLTIAHMHGLRDVSGKGDTPERKAQAERLVELIAGVWQPGERLVVCGDFNVLPDSITFDVLGRLGLADLVKTRGFTDSRTSLYAKPGRYADYMLVTSQVDVQRFDVVAYPEVSDHRPLLLEIG
ncbi:MAG: endonuclease/exonuclease/phosphatase family protein [Allorhizobium sp.]